MAEISLLLNYPLPEKYNAPWNVSRVAHSMAFSQNEGGVFFDGALNTNLWQEPNTGLIILKPFFFSDKRFDSSNTAALAATYILPSALSYGGTTTGGNIFAYAGTTDGAPDITSVYQVAAPNLAAPGDTRKSLSVNSNLSAFIGRAEFTNQNLVWSLATTAPLQENQGWSITVATGAIFGDFTGTYCLIAFGQKLILEITMAGVAYMWGDVGGNGTFVKIDTYTLRDGGVNLTEPFQVSVIPLGHRYLSVSFTQSHRGQVNRRATVATEPDYFLTILRGQGPFTNANNLEPYWDPQLNQWVKYPSDNITIGVVSNQFNYHFLVGVAIYPFTATCYLSKQFPPAKPTWNSTTDGSGIDTEKLTVEGQIELSNSISAAYTAEVLYEPSGALYTAGSGDPVIAAITLFPSGAYVYTPELYSFGLSYPPNIQTPDWTPIDVSDSWQLIRFMRTTDPNAQRVEIKLLRDWDYQFLLKGFGPCLLQAVDNSGLTQTLSTFYAERNQPTAEGPSQLIVDQFEGLDDWDRLNNTPLLIETVLEGDLVVNPIARAIQDCGFPPTEILIDYAASPELASITFAKFTNPNDLLRPNTDSSVGDFIRNIIDKLGVQFSPPLRVRRVQNDLGSWIWRIYLGPIYNTITTYNWGPCQHAFFLDDSLFELFGFESQQARYQAHCFSMQSSPEWTVNRPPFNAVLASAAKGVDGKEGAEVRYIAPPARVLNDPNYIGFEGSERVKQLGTEELQIAETADSVEQTARNWYEQHYNLKRFRFLEGSAEWQPEIDADHFVAVIGRAKEDDQLHVPPQFLQGDPVCYGAYRIEHIDIEIRHDWEKEDAAENLNTTRWEWSGSYTMVYVGPFQNSGFPGGKSLQMFTTPDNLPDDYDLPGF